MDKWRALGCGCAIASALIMAALAGALAKAVMDAFRFDE